MSQGNADSSHKGMISPPKTTATEIFETASGPPRGLDLPLFAATMALLGLGLVMVYSSSAIFASSRYKNAAYFFQRDLVYIVIGFVALYVGWKIDYRRLQAWAYPILAFAFVMLAALLIPGIGTKAGGGMRWIRFGGISIQPSEIAKLSMVIYLAYSLAKKRDAIRSFSIGFLPHLVVAGMLSALILKQPDLGSTAILFAVTLLMMFVAGTKLSYLMILFLSVLPVGYQLIVGTPWRLQRLLAFLDPWAYRKTSGYQVSESLISVGSGGFWGLGLGNGKQKLFFLPESHTDFIFATTGEELGFVGLTLVVLLFAIIVARGLRAALGASELFGTYLAFGITATFGLQALLHMSVVLGLVPTKGLTLPFYSYGGSGLLTNLFSMGLLLNIASRRGTVESDSEESRPLFQLRNRRRPKRVSVGV